MNKLTAPFVFLIILMILSCANQTEKNQFVADIEQAHKKSDFLQQKAVLFDFDLSFGGKPRLKGQITVLTNSSKARIDLADGNQIFVVNDTVFYSPALDSSKVRFDAFTWNYFMLFPYKLSDPGTKWSNPESLALGDVLYQTQQLSFQDGTGDAPDDWYIIYPNPNTHLIDVAAYIVTAHKDKAKAEENPHAIKYSNYDRINGIPIATTWTFWEWSKASGISNNIGNATLSNIQFVSVEESDFTWPDHYLPI